VVQKKKIAGEAAADKISGFPAGKGTAKEKVGQDGQEALIQKKATHKRDTPVHAIVKERETACSPRLGKSHSGRTQREMGRRKIARYRVHQGTMKGTAG